MTRFHVNDNGDAGKCSATRGQCPFGGEVNHYDSKAEARKAYEEMMDQSFGMTNFVISRLEQRADLLHNLNYERSNPVNLATAFDGERVFQVYEDNNGPEGPGYYASFGKAKLEDENLTVEYANVEFVSPQNDESRLRLFTFHHLRSFGPRSAIRSTLF